jgi:GDSL-like Lipase/Acylhydrolase family
MKRFFLTVLALITLSSIVYGYTYWQEKTAVSSFTQKPMKTSVKEKVARSDSSDEAPTETDETTLMENLPDEVQSYYAQALEAGQAFKMAIVGSDSMGMGEGGWSDQLEAALEEAYGETLTVKLYSYDVTSIDFINSDMPDEVAEFAPDLVLFEPFSWNDNGGRVAPRDNHRSIEMFLDQLKSANKNVTLLLQPSHPIYGANFYPGQVEDLEAFAESSDITYLDHWSVWPDGSDEELKSYLTSDYEEPNEKGHEAWYGYLKDYFIHTN